MAQTQLIFDLKNQKFIQSLEQPSVINPLEWYVGDVKQLSVRFVDRTSANGVSVISGTGLSVVLAIGNLTPPYSVLTNATGSGPDANDAFSFTLLLNVAAVSNAVGSNPRLGVTLEFTITSASGPEHYQCVMFIKPQVNPGTLVDPTPPDVAASLNQVLSLMVPRDGSLTGYEDSGFIMVDESDTTKRYFVSIRSGLFHIEPLN